MSVPSSRASVLFMCIHNVGRSQMAAGYLQALAGVSIDVRSAGSNPGATINPVAVQAMAEEGIDITGLGARRSHRAESRRRPRYP